MPELWQPEMGMQLDPQTFDVRTCACCQEEFVWGLQSRWLYQSRPACGLSCLVHMARGKDPCDGQNRRR